MQLHVGRELMDPVTKRKNDERVGGLSGKMGYGTQTSQSLVDKHFRGGRITQTAVRRKVQEPGALVQSTWEDSDQPGGKCRGQQSWVEGREEIPMQEFTMANQVPKSDRPCIQRLLLRM